MTAPILQGYDEGLRGVGLADMAWALRTGRPHRASGEMAFHVLEALQAFHDASERSEHVELESTCERPAPMLEGLDEATLAKREEPQGTR